MSRINTSLEPNEAESFFDGIDTKPAQIAVLKSLLRKALAELEYFKDKYGEFQPLLMSAMKNELERK